MRYLYVLVCMYQFAPVDVVILYRLYECRSFPIHLIVTVYEVSLIQPIQSTVASDVDEYRSNRAQFVNITFTQLDFLMTTLTAHFTVSIIRNTKEQLLTSSNWKKRLIVLDLKKTDTGKMWVEVR